MTESEGLPPQALDAVHDFVQKIDGSTAGHRDRRVHGSHDLVVLVESSLEAISRQRFKNPILGLSRSAEDELVRRRRTLERKREDPELQKLLFQFELILPLARNSGYGSEDDESSQEFFEERFPTWLDALTAWADESGQEELKRQASAASAAFGGIRTMITE